jgi:transposase
MNQKYIVALTPPERKKIQSIATNESATISIKKRACILLLADITAGSPMTQKEMAVRCGVSVVTIYNTIKEFCTDGFEPTFQFKRTKATNPPIITGEIEAHIVALACSSPPTGSSKWTLNLLTHKVIELKILDTVSRETIRTTLKKRNLSLT